MTMLRQISCWLCLLPDAGVGLSMPSIAVTQSTQTVLVDGLNVCGYGWTCYTMSWSSAVLTMHVTKQSWKCVELSCTLPHHIYNFL